ncbi:MAG: hypothetical protein HY508_05590, partial [Acidobacteria bacterium]|nr:hypothetical protein [Acidobacteriota bacterium]
RSERRACQLAGMGRSMCRYGARRRDDPELRQRLRELAIRLFIMLRDKIDYPEFCRRGSHAGMLGDVALV